MVNTGKPSGACGVCRERRIKCDETKPSCLKCTRSGRACSGYCPGLKLRDQTQKTITKARLGKLKGRAQTNGSFPSSMEGSLASRGLPDHDRSRRSRDTSPKKPRSYSSATPSRPEAPSTDASGAGGEESASTDADDNQLLCLEAPTKNGFDVESPRWQTLHTPLIEKARCYFLSSQCSLMLPLFCTSIFLYFQVSGTRSRSDLSAYALLHHVQHTRRSARGQLSLPWPQFLLEVLVMLARKELLV